MKRLLRLSLPLWLLSFIVPSAFAGERTPESFLARFPAIEHTKAFEQYRSRPENELSKMLYLIDRFGETDVEILYDGKTFKTGMVARMARWFIKTHYKNEAAQTWIQQWCYRTIPSGVVVWVKGKDGSYYPAREVLLEELFRLEHLMETLKTGTPLPLDLSRLETQAVKPEAPAKPVELPVPLPQLLAVATQN